MVASVDPVTVEVIWHALLAAANEMKTALRQSSYNFIINEMHDFSVALFNEKAETVAQAPGLPAFLCDIPSAIHSIAADIGGFERFAEGDIYLTNDPYANTFHIWDVNVIKPVFWEGALVGFAGARAHWQDLGGSSGSGATNSTEVYQEGLILKSIRLYDRGVLNEEVLRIIRENSRLPEAVVGDLRAQRGACEIGARRLMELIARYGPAVFRASVQQIFRNGDQLALEKLKTIRPGEYLAEGWVDNDAVELDVPLRVKARVTVSPEQMLVDLTGSHPRCKGPFNNNRNTTTSFCRLIFKILTTPNEPANEGHFWRLKVAIPPDSIFDAQKPCSTMLGFAALETLLDVVKSALAPAMPELVNAHDYGKCTPAHMKGHDQQGRYFTFPDTEGGGMGASAHGDGESGIKGHDTVVISAEVLEARVPLRVVQNRLRQDSGGPGRFRGGLGIEKDYLCLVDVRLNAALERQLFPPQGILGGLPAKHNQVIIKSRQGQIRLPSKVTDYPVAAGAIISLQTGVGGGYGPPSQRPLELVQEDLDEGYISRQQAEEIYAVVCRPDGTIDLEQSWALRARLRPLHA
ncbi:MAG: hydantoinase B/oxoprolinase family protein [Ardenticatenaceae bacterium]|nr:hydantoinase B/oxoprolinase family protein [Ardenticatenaceae bacterium]